MASHQSQQSENEPHPSSSGSSERTLTSIAPSESAPLPPLTEEQILPKSLFLELKANNFYLDIAFLKRTNQVVIEILKGHPLFHALSETTQFLKSTSSSFGTCSLTFLKKETYISWG